MTSNVAPAFFASAMGMPGSVAHGNEGKPWRTHLRHDLSLSVEHDGPKD